LTLLRRSFTVSTGFVRIMETTAITCTDFHKAMYSLETGK
jgi:hypothetical protein